MRVLFALCSCVLLFNIASAEAKKWDRASIKLGDQVTIEVGLLAKDLDTYRDLEKRLKAKDNVGINEMVKAKQVTLIDKGNAAKVTDFVYSLEKGGYARVRLLTGPHKDKEGYIDAAELGPPKN